MIELENIVRDKRANYILLLKVAEDLEQKENCKYYRECILKLDKILKVLTKN